MIGLDPAGPLYYFTQPHLSTSDARFVDIIHTDCGFYGNAMNTGTVDFFPNGGKRIQPGCQSHPKFFSKDGIFSLSELADKQIVPFTSRFLSFQISAAIIVPGDSTPSL